MAKTYDTLPLSVPEVFRELVGDVSDNLSTESTLNIDSVSYKCETWIELVSRLQSESTDQTITKYPLVALIRNFDEKFNASDSTSELSLTLVIVTPSDVNKISEHRETDNYVPILRPIYAELMSVISYSGYFADYSEYWPEHEKVETFRLGSDSPYGNKAYLLPDHVDGIVVSNLKLRLLMDRCYGRNVQGPVTSLRYLNNVSELLISEGMSKFDLTLVSAQYTDTMNVGSEFSYYAVTEHDNQELEINVGDTLTYSGLQHYNDGYYKGYIKGDDGITVSKLYFYYIILGGKLRGCSKISKFVLQNFITDGGSYTDYPFDVVTRHTSLTKLYMTQELFVDGGNSQWLETYQPAVSDTGTDTNTITQPLSTSYRDVVDAVLIDQALLLENISYYKQS